MAYMIPPPPPCRPKKTKFIEGTFYAWNDMVVEYCDSFEDVVAVRNITTSKVYCLGYHELQECPKADPADIVRCRSEG